jgi:hypothetical protein
VRIVRCVVENLPLRWDETSERRRVSIDTRMEHTAIGAESLIGMWAGRDLQHTPSCCFVSRLAMQGSVLDQSSASCVRSVLECVWVVLSTLVFRGQTEMPASRFPRTEAMATSNGVRGLAPHRRHVTGQVSLGKRGSGEGRGPACPSARPLGLRLHLRLLTTSTWDLHAACIQYCLSDNLRICSSLMQSLFMSACLRSARAALSETTWTANQVYSPFLLKAWQAFQS